MDKIVPDLPSGRTTITEGIAQAAQLAAEAERARAKVAAGNALLKTIRKTMKTVDPVIRDAAKITFDVGQLLLKTCITLNGGAVIGFPAFYKAIAPTDAPVTPAFIRAFYCFSAGVALAGVAVLVAFWLTGTAARMSSYAATAAIFEAQNNLLPESLDKAATKRLRKGRHALKWTETVALTNQYILLTLAFVSIGAFLLGGYWGQKAISSLVAHPTH
jgi:hypothetical protein